MGEPEGESAGGAWRRAVPDDRGLLPDDRGLLPDDRGLLPDAVAGRILRRILAGGLRAGERLPPERELALELGVNRSSVREALKKLEELRLVEIQRGSGTRVRDARHASLELVREASFPGGRPDGEWIRDLLGVREMLLPGLVRAMTESAPAEQLRSAAALLRGAASPQLSDSEFAAALAGLPVALCELGGNRVAVILANSLERFLGADRQGGEPGDRQALTPVLRRLAVTLDARDAASAERCARDLVRRLNLRTQRLLLAPLGEVDRRKAPR